LKSKIQLARSQGAFINPENCYCLIRFLEGSDHEKNLRFKILVRFAESEWTVYRHDKQIIDLNLLFTSGINAKIHSIEGKFPKKEAGVTTLDMCERYNEYFQILVDDRSALLGDPKAGSHFMRFISPTQSTDETPKDFVLPFRLETL